MSSRVAPYGTWRSPLPASTVANAGLRLSSVMLDGDDIYWLEGRPSEGGRYVLVRRTPDGVIKDVTPSGTNVRTRVHEYGGGACTVSDGVVYFTNFSDQRIYRINVDEGEQEPITPAGAWRYADFVVDERRQRLICVREDHSQEGREAVNTLVSVPIGPAEAGHDVRPHDMGGAGEVIASGYDFYSTPRLSPDGSQLTWVCWRHPRMPWDGSELWIAGVTESGSLTDARCIAGGDAESIYQPGWSPDGDLYYVSDRTGWWTLYRSSRSSHSDRSIVRGVDRSEFGEPAWVFGTAMWAFAGRSRMVVSYSRGGFSHLATLDPDGGVLVDLAPGLQPHEWLTATSTHVVLVAGFATKSDAVVRIELASGSIETLREASSVSLDEADISIAEPVEFPTGDNVTGHAFYYPPRNHQFTGPQDEAPPLIVISHGGPTAAASPTLNLNIQFWTTRGFAVVDVNYRGSSGYGREYRERLNGRWGIVDVEDVINAARSLCSRGLADERRLIIRGGSAGGYTTLAALAFRPGVFAAGASYYGICDLELLARDTHKFESRYLDSLVGPYPDALPVYRARSPVRAADQLHSALILFQGLEDVVVPPSQSELMADAVRRKGLPVAYLAFPGEQHGFRRRETIVRCLEAELYFYAVVFGFTPAEPLPLVPIDNSRGI